jgi:hypothetical protein
LRAVEDDHVDRPGVEVRQRMELTGTNSSIGLIALIIQCPCCAWRDRRVHLLHCCSLPAWWLSAKRSDPIPSRTRPSNASAPMVLCLKTWESRSSPGLQRTTSFLCTKRGLQWRTRASFQFAISYSHNGWRGVEQPGSSSGS